LDVVSSLVENWFWRDDIFNLLRSNQSKVLILSCIIFIKLYMNGMLINGLYYSYHYVLIDVLKLTCCSFGIGRRRIGKAMSKAHEMLRARIREVSWLSIELLLAMLQHQ